MRGNSNPTQKTKEKEVNLLEHRSILRTGQMECEIRKSGYCLLQFDNVHNKLGRELDSNCSFRNGRIGLWNDRYF